MIKSVLSKTIAAVICTVLVAAGAVVFLLPSGKPQSSREAVQDGVAYIKELETKDITEVDQELKLRVSMEALEGMDVWEKLDYFDTYIMGDSRTAIFNWSGINPDHIWAEASTTIKWIEEKKDLIENAKPKNLVLSFGMNDIGMYDTDPEHYWETAEDYVEAYRYYVDLIREVSPETHIYINSIVPALPAGIERQPRWAIAPEWNAALNEFCSAYGIGFIDVDYLADRYAEYYEADGVHLYYMDALNDWGESILEAVENKEFGL